MSQTLSFLMFLLICFCIITEGASQICMKKAADDSAFTKIIMKPILWLGIILWAVEVVAWTNVLEHVPLSIAFPMMSLTYVTTLTASAWVFKEKVNKRHALGALLITAGVACVGATGI